MKYKPFVDPRLTMSAEEYYGWRLSDLTHPSWHRRLYMRWWLMGNHLRRRWRTLRRMR